MRKSAINDCINILKLAGVNPWSGAAIDIGGTDIVNLDGNFTQNPLLQLNQGITFLDKGFNAQIIGAKADQLVDFLEIASIEHLKGRFDMVFSFDTIEHIPNPFLFCEHLLFITKPGGYIYLSTVFEWAYHPSPEDYYRFSPKGLCELFLNPINKRYQDFEGIWCGWGSDPRGVSLLGRRLT